MNNHEGRQIDDRRTIEAAEAGLQDTELDNVLTSFRQSVHAWSDAEFARPRTVSPVVHRANWRVAAGWALGCVLFLGGLSAGLLDHHRNEVREQASRQAAAAQQAQQPQITAQPAATQAEPQPAATASDDDARLMASVDKDVSREVPSAMEPLAQLMNEGENQ